MAYESRATAGGKREVTMIRESIYLACALGLSTAIAVDAHARDDDSVRVVQGSNVRSYHVAPGMPQSVRVVTRVVVAPEATVSRELAEQPVRPYLIEMRVNGTTVYLDPNEDYEHQGPGVLDEAHSIPRGQQLGRALRAQGVQVSYGAQHPRSAQNQAQAIKPLVIIEKPRSMKAPAPGSTPGPAKNIIPAVPAPAEKPTGQIAQAPTAPTAALPTATQ